MTSENILYALDGLDYDLIIKAAPKEKKEKWKSRKTLVWPLIAASVFLVLSASLIISTIINQNIISESKTGFIANSYDKGTSKPTLPIFVTASFLDYVSLDKDDGNIKVPIGIATELDYSGDIIEDVPNKTVFRIETENIAVDGASFVYEREIDITDPDFKSVNKIADKVYPYSIPLHYEYHYFDFSNVKSGDSGTIEIRLANYFDDSKEEFVCLHVYYAVKGSIIAFSRDSLEDAASKAKKEFVRKYLPLGVVFAE